MPKLKFPWFRRFASEDGSATIEVVLWTPAFLFGFGLIFDVTVMFFAETEAMRVVQDANRLASIGRLETPADTETYIETRLSGLSANVDAQSSVSAFGVVTSSASIPASGLGMLRLFSQLDQLTLRVEADHMMEDFL